MEIVRFSFIEGQLILRRVAATLGLLSATVCCASNSAAVRTGPADAGIGGGGRLALDSGVDAGLLAGTLVDLRTNRPLAGRKVVVGDQTAITDRNGSFILKQVPVPYDAVIVEPDRSAVSIYKSLTRRDPLLVHVSSPTAEKTWNGGMVAGNVSGGGPYPLGAGNLVNVFFFSPEVTAETFLGAGLQTGAGPQYQLGMQWLGPTSTSGRILALGAFPASDDAGTVPPAWFAGRDLTISAKSAAVADLTLLPVPLARLTGNALAPPDYPPTQILTYYNLSIPFGRLPLRNDLVTGSTFDMFVPDLMAYGWTLCVELVHLSNSGAPRLMTDQCGVTFDSASTMTLQQPPALLTPTAGSTVAMGATFSWTAFARGVHLLKLEPILGSIEIPPIYIFTSDVSAQWPDLSAQGVAFPGGQRYRATIGGYGPFSTIDDAVGPSGLGAVMRSETRQSFSATTNLLTASP